MSVCRAGGQVITVSTLLSLVSSQSFIKCKLAIHYCYYCCDYILLPFFRIYRHVIHLNTILWYWNYLKGNLIQWRFTVELGHLTPVQWHPASLVSAEFIPGCSHGSQSIQPFCWQTPLGSPGKFCWCSQAGRALSWMQVCWPKRTLPDLALCESGTNTKPDVAACGWKCWMCPQALLTVQRDSFPGPSWSVQAWS